MTLLVVFIRMAFDKPKIMLILIGAPPTNA